MLNILIGCAQFCWLLNITVELDKSECLYFQKYSIRLQGEINVDLVWNS